MAINGHYLNLNEHGLNNLTSTNTALSVTSPQLGFALTPTSNSAEFGDLAATFSEYGNPPAQNKSVSDVLRSLTGSHHTAQSYELIDEDDYDLEVSQITPRQPKDMVTSMAGIRPEYSGEDVPVRTASISRHLPLHNPTPDLQSLQGAYVKNVQALEDSAERISLAASIEEELQRMKMEIRRSESIGKNSQYASESHTRQFSAKSNSIIGVNAAARSGGYSPSAVTSPIGSMRSQRKVSQRASRMSRASVTSNVLPEPELEGRPLESAMVHSPPAHVMQPRQSSESQRSISQGSVHDRPGTSASNDTYRQAQNLFTDFDGTHFSPTIEDDGLSRRISLGFPALARDSRVFREAQPDQKTVYYPAPVPVMLNLPKRLSKHNWAQQEKRRTIALSSIPAENRQSAAWLANAEIDAEFEDNPRKRMSNIPPQLRASAFFDSPSTRSDIHLKHGSAVITLDSILDAAAHAPVSAFTDHPIAGHLGREVYGQENRHKKKSSESRQKRKSSMSNLLARRKSVDALSTGRRLSQTLDNEIEIPEDDPERSGEKSLAPDADELINEDEQLSGNEHDPDQKSSDGESENEELESEHQLGFLGAPTTLLAELQLRKAQQKLRNRTAANAFPTGMHSTLLELDAVTQLQQRSRKQKHVALAWEDKDVIDKANFEDEDVPLGVLFPEKDRQSHTNMHRPLGLMEKKELEENETLGSRRARLRGETYRPAQAVSVPIAEEPAPTIHLAGIDNDDDDDEGETLAQRRKRMQEKGNKRLSLADEIANQLGVELEQPQASEAVVPELEETLGQRKKRLQAEAETNAPQLKQKTSMGDLLRANPVGPRMGERQASAESKIALLMNRRDTSMPFVDQIQAQQPQSKVIPSNPPPYFPNQPLMGRGLQVGQQPPMMQQQQQQPQSIQTPGMYMPQMHSMQSMPNLHMMAPAMNTNPNAAFGVQPQYPYGAQNMNMSNMSLGMMYNPMTMGMGAVQMPMGGYTPAVPAYDTIGMGPPLNPQQRANIDRWRQSVL